MITFEYISVIVPPDYIAFQTALTEYGSTGWRFVTVYNGYMFFERKIKTKVN